MTKKYTGHEFTLGQQVKLRGEAEQYVVVQVDHERFTLGVVPGADHAVDKFDRILRDLPFDAVTV